MQAGAIETNGLAHLDIMLQSLIRGSCPDAIRIESLIQHQTLEIGLIVEVEVTICQMNLAHASIAAYLVDHLACLVFHNIFHIIEIRTFRAPQLRLLDGQNHQTLVGCLDALGGYYLLAIQHLHSQSVVVVLLIEFWSNHQLLLIDVWLGKDTLQTFLGNSLHPNGLPNASGASVVAPC